MTTTKLTQIVEEYKRATPKVARVSTKSDSYLSAKAVSNDQQRKIREMQLRNR